MNPLEQAFSLFKPPESTSRKSRSPVFARIVSVFTGVGLLLSPEMAAPVHAQTAEQTPPAPMAAPAGNENQPNSEQEMREYKEALHQFAVQVVKAMDESAVKITNGDLTKTIAQLMEQNRTPLQPEKTVATAVLDAQVTADTVRVVIAFINDMMVVGNRPNYPGKSDLAIFKAEKDNFTAELAFRFYTVIQEVRRNFAEKAAVYNQQHANEPWKNVDLNNPSTHPQGYPTPARGTVLALLERAEAAPLTELNHAEATLLWTLLKMAPEHFSSYLRQNEGREIIAGNGVLGYLNEKQFRYVFQRDSAQFTELMNSLYDWQRMEPVLKAKYTADHQAVTMNQAALEMAIKSAADQSKNDASK